LASFCGSSGRLSYPVSILFFNGNGIERLGPASQDGNALATALDKASSNLLPVRRSEGGWGDVERWQRSLTALGTLASDEAKQPGRKMVLWISPGWPLLITTEARSSGKIRDTVFSEIVALSTGLRRARITLYSIDPINAMGSSTMRWFRYRDYLKGVTKVKDADTGDLALQVLSEQSGGRVQNYSQQYLSGELASCMADAGAYYLVSFDAAPTEQTDEYHSLKITVDRPDLTVHTRASYYDHP